MARDLHDTLPKNEIPKFSRHWPPWKAPKATKRKTAGASDVPALKPEGSGRNKRTPVTVSVFDDAAGKDVYDVEKIVPPSQKCRLQTLCIVHYVTPS